ncbi:MAG: tetratricopeptide repeat protein [Bacteroidetes bacterium]|nr:tetratricopeptide repeat protein [Bacteroidota bacterium]MBT3751674.1 tetratricopeptide repeat protein [Bacteroidota bacterium]MBT4401918.1 tetratricopeptide repeat protein [Bacteroidota bacterium]MBT4410131.1 tetratricopeptide repeat protein [Bacteroidota bacterium]MBT5424781.1 tetratricopeptide repeat protein [Bacteroidota bacterium]
MKNNNQKAVIMAAFLFLLGLSIVLTGCKTGQTDDSVDQNEVIEENDASVEDSVHSVADLTTMIRSNPLNSGLFAKRAEAQAAAGNFEEALNDISLAIKLDSLNPSYYVIQAEYFIFGGEPNSAKKGLTQCLNLFPDNTEIMLKLAEIHFYLQEYSQSKGILRQVKLIDNDIAQIYFIDGLILLENKDTTNAIRNMRFAIEKEPEFYPAFIALGRIHSAQNNDLAIDYYRAAADIIPDSYEARYNLGLYLQDHNYSTEAINEYQYIIDQIDSTLANPYYNIGYINLIYVEDFDQALEYFTLALEKDPEYVDAWYNRGFVYEITGKYKKARDDYQQSLEISPNYALSIKGLNRLDDNKPFQYK